MRGGRIGGVGFAMLGILGYILIVTYLHQPITLRSMIVFALYYLMYGGGVWFLASRLGYSAGTCRVLACGAGSVLIINMIIAYR